MAFALMQAEAEENVSITEIAARVGIGMRCLQIAFAQHYGLTPREMLTRLRLDRARERLLAGEPGARVTAIALDAGFTHLSRFSVSYHQAFGERPVETLRRARAEPLLRAAE
ncbi:helix-turn-helix domain-containing protein [Rhodobacter viridis]|nr:helix-turn-helix domain-containing protein [Rhodobacter viridis]